MPGTIDPFPRDLQPLQLEEDEFGNHVLEEPGWETTETEKRDLKAWFTTARAGDHLMTPFQCELCHFRNIYKRDPDVKDEHDAWALKCMIRAYLDAFWARRSSTVQGNMREMTKAMTILAGLRISSPAPKHRRGPYPLEDTLGMIPAMVSLQRSLDKGKNSRTIQWDTMRGIRSAFSNFVHSTPSGSNGAVLSDGRKSTRVTDSVSNTLWFKRFMDGSHERMGDVKIQDAAMSVDVLMALGEVLERRYQEAEQCQDEKQVFDIANVGAALMIGFSSALRGEELGHARLFETRELSNRGHIHPTRPHVLIALEGRFKGMIARQKHKIPLAERTKSGIQNRKWLVRLMRAYERRQITHGPLFRMKPTGERPSTIQQLDLWLHELLVQCQKKREDLLGNELESLGTYSFRRSLRRGSTTQARNKRVPKDVIVLNNRWRSQEHARGRFAQADMIDLYTDVVAALETLLQYSSAL